MKLRIWAAVVIFLSGYAPLAWIVALMDFDFTRGAFNHPTVAGAVLGVSFFSVAVLWLTIRSLRGELIVEVTEVEDHSHELLNYALPYISSFAIGDVLAKLNNGLAVLAFLGLIGVMTVCTQIVLINPLLTVFGFHLYELKVKEGGLEYFRLVLSRTPPEEGGKLKVCALSRALLFGEAAFNNI